ncbi:MAG: peptidylprolyl isomerase [Planctomycetes bacterium]|nr:peptidylprolyl isomerase [Planctomycetota bacterium]
MPKAIMKTSKGTINLDLFDEDAPETVKNFVDLSKKGYYDALTFHRVIPNFMIQGGCPDGTGMGGPGYKIKCEINNQLHTPGTLSMAHAGKDTGGSQFFITHVDTPHLDGVHTVFGRTQDMDVVNQIQVGDTIESVSIED